MARSLGTLLPGATSSLRELPPGVIRSMAVPFIPNRLPPAAAAIRTLQAETAADTDRPPPQALVGPQRACRHES